MALGRRKELQQGELFIAANVLPSSDGHVFYTKLNSLLAEAGFDTWIEASCLPHYKNKGRPRSPPGVYFRMSDDDHENNRRQFHCTAPG
jgi:hypothetical protein